MNLSTSNSDKYPLACLITIGILAIFRLVDFMIPADSPAQFAREIPGPDYYLAYSYGHLDHAILYYGENNVLEPLRKADVLFLGNSRLMSAMKRQKLKPFFDKLGLNYYVLGFGHSERSAFPELLIKKHSLYPKLVIINADDFFYQSYSDFAKQVINSSYFESLKYRWEIQLSHEARKILVSPTLVKIIDRDLSTRASSLLYRSSQDGTWYYAEAKGKPQPVTYDPRKTGVVSKSYLASAKRFVEMLKKRGAKVLLIYVPAVTDNHWQAKKIAEALEVEFISPPSDGLMTFDGSHLAPTSANKYCEALLNDLDKYLNQHPVK